MSRTPKSRTPKPLSWKRTGFDSDEADWLREQNVESMAAIQRAAGVGLQELPSQRAELKRRHDNMRAQKPEMGWVSHDATRLLRKAQSVKKGSVKKGEVRCSLMMLALVSYLVLVTRRMKPCECGGAELFYSRPFGYASSVALHGGAQHGDENVQGSNGFSEAWNGIERQAYKAGNAVGTAFSVIAMLAANYGPRMTQKEAPNGGSYCELCWAECLQSASPRQHDVATAEDGMLTVALRLSMTEQWIFQIYLPSTSGDDAAQGTQYVSFFHQSRTLRRARRVGPNGLPAQRRGSTAPSRGARSDVETSHSWWYAG